MKNIVIVGMLLLECASMSADSSVEDVLRNAPLLDAPGPGYPGRNRDCLNQILFISIDPKPKDSAYQLDLYLKPLLNESKQTTKTVTPWNQQFRLTPAQSNKEE